jgi:hypothetical protein
VFSEAKDVQLLDRRAPSAPVMLKSGQFYQRTGDAKPAVQPRPPRAFIDQVPKAFLDTLPTRAEQFKARAVQPKALGEPTYAEVEAWIDAEPALRRSYVARWTPLARNPAFRSGLVARMSAHPEWDRILFPEKYLPKPASAASAPASAPASR